MEDSSSTRYPPLEKFHIRLLTLPQLIHPVHCGPDSWDQGHPFRGVHSTEGRDEEDSNIVWGVRESLSEKALGMAAPNVVSLE